MRRKKEFWQQRHNSWHLSQIERLPDIFCVNPSVEELENSVFHVLVDFCTFFSPARSIADSSLQRLIVSTKNQFKFPHLGIE
jgi:hypothetical protein